MTATSPVLVLLEQPRPGVTVTPMEPTASNITGRRVRRVELHATVGAQDHEPLSAQLSAARSDGAPIADIDGGRWRVLNNSYSYTDGGTSTLHEHRAELEEIEDLDLRVVAFDGIELRPERFALEFIDGVIVLEIAVEVGAQVSIRIEDRLVERRAQAARSNSSRYFPVEWRGIIDEPVSMRFGRCLWQSGDGGFVRHLLVFVSESGDANKEPFTGFNQPELARLLDSSVASKARLATLITELRTAGVIEAAAVDRIEQAARDDDYRARRAYERAENVDLFFTGR